MKLLCNIPFLFQNLTLLIYFIIKDKLLAVSCIFERTKTKIGWVNRFFFMKIHLIRHAKTDPTSPTGKDIDRKLLPKGIVQANVLAYYLKDHAIQPEITWCSNATRTRETLSIIHNQLELGKISFHNDLYLADREVYLKKIWDLNHGKELLIVGHNDGISSFVNYLTDENISMKTGEYICIDFTADTWQQASRGTGKITAAFRPSVFLPA